MDCPYFYSSEIKTIKPVIINTVSNLETTTTTTIIQGKARSGSSNSTTPSSTPQDTSSVTTTVSTGTASSLTYVASCTAVTFLSNEILLVGYSDGVVRAFTVSSGACVRTYFVNSSESNPSSSPSSSSSSSPSGGTTITATPSSQVRIPFASSMLMKPLTVADLTSSSPSKLAVYSTSAPVVSQREVTCIAAYGIGPATPNSGTTPNNSSENNPPILLAVGRKDGTLDKFDLVTGQFLVSFKCGPGLSNLLPLRRFGCLASVHEDKNIMTIWDIQADRTVQLDFTSELESTGRKLSKLSFATYDDYRGVIMTGDDAGSVYVRSVSRIAETNDLAVKLVRIAAPAPTASAPTRVTAMYYDTKVDVMFTGDASGLCRLVPKASSIPFKSIPEKDKNEVDKTINGTLYTNLLTSPWSPRITEIQTLTLVQLKNAITALNLSKPMGTLQYSMKKNNSPSKNNNNNTNNSTANIQAVDRLQSLKNNNNNTSLSTNTIQQTPVSSGTAHHHSSHTSPVEVLSAYGSAVSTAVSETGGNFMSPPFSPALPYPETPTTVKKAVLFTSPESTTTTTTTANTESLPSEPTPPSLSSSTAADTVTSSLPEIGNVNHNTPEEENSSSEVSTEVIKDSVPETVDTTTTTTTLSTESSLTVDTASASGGTETTPSTDTTDI